MLKQKDASAKKGVMHHFTVLNAFLGTAAALVAILGYWNIKPSSSPPVVKAPQSVVTMPPQPMVTPPPMKAPPSEPQQLTDDEAIAIDQLEKKFNRPSTVPSLAHFVNTMGQLNEWAANKHDMSERLQDKWMQVMSEVQSQNTPDAVFVRKVMTEPSLARNSSSTRVSYVTAIAAYRLGFRPH